MVFTLLVSVAMAANAKINQQNETLVTHTTRVGSPKRDDGRHEAKPDIRDKEQEERVRTH